MEKNKRASKNESLWPRERPAAQGHGYSWECKASSQTPKVPLIYWSQHQLVQNVSNREHPPDPHSSGGRKRALLCGVSYRNKRKFRLKGTVTDVQSIKNLLLTRFQFPSTSIKVLTEDACEAELVPTKKNMERGLGWLVEDCRAGDSLVFFFSGHGLQQVDSAHDEKDGFDETLCPSDFLTEGLITDNYINDTIVRPLPVGVKLHAIVDACHSGTVLDLPYVYDRKEEKWIDNWLPSNAPKGTSGGFAVCFSACADNQQAADTDAFSPTNSVASSSKKRKNVIGGALTTTFVKTIEEKPKISYGELLVSMQNAIDEVNNDRGGRFRLHFFRRVFHRLLLQEPQLSSSAAFDIHNREFNL